MSAVMVDGDRQYFTKGKLTRLVRGEYDLKITSETITAKGYRGWNAVTCMDTNEKRLSCSDWVIGLIKRGILKQES
jgi:hypothetical protein